MPLPSLKRRTTKPRKPKSSQFTDEQIRERAYMLSLKHPEQPPEANWHAAIAALKRERSLFWQLRQSWRTATPKENRDFTLDVVKVLISAFGVLATVFAGVGLYLTYRNSQAQLESAQQERQLNSERLVTDRFAKAIEQLGSQDMDVRIGGIYSLERIAKDSPKDHWTIMEVLMAFVRNKSPLPQGWKRRSKQELATVTTDVQSALTVIGRRKADNDPQGQRVDLSFTNLRGANLHNANLKGAFISRANLSGANLKGANLYGAILSGANLDGADIEGVDLQNSLL